MTGRRFALFPPVIPSFLAEPASPMPRTKHEMPPSEIAAQVWTNGSDLPESSRVTPLFYGGCTESDEMCSVSDKIVSVSDGIDCIADGAVSASDIAVSLPAVSASVSDKAESVSGKLVFVAAVSRAVPDAFRGAGVLPNDMEKGKRLLVSLSSADIVQETAKISNTKASTGRNALRKRVEDAVDRIRGAGMLHFHDKPAVATRFAALVPAKGTGGAKEKTPPAPAVKN
jgi:hypothetical protein